MIQHGGYIMLDIKPDKLHGKQKPGMMSWVQSANWRNLVSVAWNREGRCTLHDCQNFSRGKVRSFVVGFKDIYFYQISQTSTCSHPSAKLYWWKEVNLQPISIRIELSELTFEPVSPEDRDMIWHAWFRFLNFVFWLVVDHLNLLKYVQVSTWHTSLTVTSMHQKLNLCINRLAVVHYWEHCWKIVFSTADSQRASLQANSGPLTALSNEEKWLKHNNKQMVLSLTCPTDCMYVNFFQLNRSMKDKVLGSTTDLAVHV